jgi:hypothetical protein
MRVGNLSIELSKKADMTVPYLMIESRGGVSFQKPLVLQAVLVLLSK